jgi:hypothetical protein
MGPSGITGMTGGDHIHFAINSTACKSTRRDGGMETDAKDGCRLESCGYIGPWLRN